MVAPIVGHGADVAHEPAREIEIVNAHVEQHAAAALRVRVLQTRPERIARRGLEHQRRADPPRLDLFLRGRITGVEATHESHLEEDAGSCDRLLHRRDFRQRERRRLLAERRLAALRRRDDQLAMRVGRADDHQRVDRRVVDERAPDPCSAAARRTPPPLPARASRPGSATATSRVSAMRLARSRAYTRPRRPRPINPTARRPLRAMVISRCPWSPVRASL